MQESKKGPENPIYAKQIQFKANFLRTKKPRLPLLYSQTLRFFRLDLQDLFHFTLNVIESLNTILSPQYLYLLYL